ncbi:MAG: hypothetical protein MUP24_06235 [Gillisia sp.]|nr:hypothetical protein [Gillisia sp.]
MTTSDSNLKFAFLFSSPAIYQIKVLGKVPPSWSERLSGMNLSYEETETGIATTLIGKLSDQSALSGILNSLYDLHMSVLSVEKLNNKL